MRAFPVKCANASSKTKSCRNFTQKSEKKNISDIYNCKLQSAFLMTISKIPNTMADLVREHPHLVVNIDDFSHSRTIGKGGAAEVFHSYDSKLKEECAVKQLYKEDLSDKSMAHLIREIHTMALINNRFCMPMLGFTAVPPYCLVLEYLSNGSLDDAIFRPKKKAMSETHVHIIAICIANGMAHIHSKGVFHRDLKPGNVLLDKKEIPRICDFGLARMEDGSKTTKGIGTPTYMPPEQIESNNYTHKVDIYAYGVMLYEMVERQRAYPGYSQKMDLVNAVMRGERPAFTKKTHKTMQKLISRCWDNDPDKRPEFTEIFDQLADGKAKWKDSDMSKVEKIVTQIREKERQPEAPREATSKIRVNIDKLLDELEPERVKVQEQAEKAKAEKMNKPLIPRDSSDEFEEFEKAPEIKNIVSHEVKRRNIAPEPASLPQNSPGVLPPTIAQQNPLYRPGQQLPQPFPNAPFPMQAPASSSGYRGPPGMMHNTAAQRQNAAFLQMHGNRGMPMHDMTSSPIKLPPQMPAPPLHKAALSAPPISDHPCPEVPPPEETPIPVNMPPIPTTKPAFAPQPQVQESSPPAFANMNINIPVDPTIIAQTSHPQFCAKVEQLATMAEEHHLVGCATALAPHTKRGTSPLAQLTVLMTMFRLCVRFGITFIEPLIESGAFNGMPFADKSCEIAAADLLAIVFQRAPKLVSPKLWVQFCHIARVRPLDAVVLLRLLVNDPSQINPAVMQLIVPSTTLFAGTNAAPRAVALLHYLLQKSPLFVQNYGNLALAQIVAFSQSPNVATAKMAYYALANNYKPGIQLDYYFMLWHMNLPQLIEPVLSVFIKIDELPQTLEISRALIKAAKVSPLGAAVLQKYADTSIYHANVFLYDTSWYVESLPTILDTVKLLMILFKYPPLRPEIAKNTLFPMMLRNMIASKFPFIIVVLVSIIRRCNLNPELVKSFALAGVFRDWYRVGLALQDMSVMQNLQVLTDTIMRVQFIPDLAEIIPAEIDIVRTKNPAALLAYAYMNLEPMSQYEVCAKQMVSLGLLVILQKEIDSLPPEVAKLARSIQDNLRKYT